MHRIEVQSGTKSGTKKAPSTVLFCEQEAAHLADYRFAWEGILERRADYEYPFSGNAQVTMLSVHLCIIVACDTGVGTATARPARRESALRPLIEHSLSGPDAYPIGD